jgi:hypothetical protein
MTLDAAHGAKRINSAARMWRDKWHGWRKRMKIADHHRLLIAHATPRGRLWKIDVISWMKHPAQLWQALDVSLSLQLVRR